ncbi:TFIIB-type zinc ribbon-containing protein [Salinadaptatus halalkaliphilus]|uniref:TFIIB-type zinc ribbon-containing protein n=1 Tax=Salinadaptatus halalkaliphilus TaxID=2419781 RepID=A0A4S3TK05_9EURY|nr:TFIIB-type zinc ribbon-containing protein [Salinadaptatus halalkaliphilus]THE64401.1 TFIIB-type zinc ribbon-containing protein [Salinadaptatus halalkaliphilus]
MKIRGERECTSCGTRWSYYETGSIGCPACGSLQSVGLDERTEHTDLRVAFDLTEVRADIDDVPTEDLANRAHETAREYVRQRGFIKAGALQPLDDTYLVAAELRHVADAVSRRRSLEEREELYFLSLLRDADGGDRPAVDEVPQSLRGGRGLAYANAVREYRRDVRTWAADRDHATSERQAVETLGEHVKRIRMLDGDVEPRTAEQLIEATRELADGLRGDDAALTRAQDRLERLEVGGVDT